MEARVQSRTDPVELTGSDFRQTRVNCPGCAWHGVAGVLVSIPDSRSRSSTWVNFRCPNCDALVATHAGLTNIEVLCELDRIKQELRDEFLDLRIEQQLQIIDPDFKQPEFSQVRERFYRG